MKKLLSILLIVAVLISLLPSGAYAITLGEYEQKLNKYETDAKNNQNAINRTESEINSANREIDNLKQEMIDLSKEIVKLDEEIKEYNQKIKDKILQSRQLLEYLQLSSGENAYLNYVFEAETPTDLIYRAAVVQQMADYNEKVMTELEEMIKKNEERQVEIDKRQKEIDKKEVQLQDKLVYLGNEKVSLKETSVSVAQQIKIYQEIVNAYKKVGCKSTDVIGVDCATNGDAGLFRRPTTSGYVTSEFGWRGGSFHRGLDVGSSKGRGEKIYPIANGTIIAKYYDYYGALTLAIEHYSAVKNQWYTSLYVHMSSYAPDLYVGKKVTSDQYIGYMGDTGYAFGVHLHIEVAACRLYNLNDSNCSSWAKYVSFVEKQASKGFKGARGLITFPNGTYNSWYSR